MRIPGLQDFRVSVSFGPELSSRNRLSQYILVLRTGLQTKNLVPIKAMTRDRLLTDRELERDRQSWSKYPSQQLVSSLGKHGEEISPLSIRRRTRRRTMSYQPGIFIPKFTVTGIVGAFGKTKAHSLNLPRLLKFSAIGILLEY